MPNFMKIRIGREFFVDLVWNDPQAYTVLHKVILIYSHFLYLCTSIKHTICDQILENHQYGFT